MSCLLKVGNHFSYCNCAAKPMKRQVVMKFRIDIFQKDFNIQN